MKICIFVYDLAFCHDNQYEHAHVTNRELISIGESSCGQPSRALKLSQKHSETDTWRLTREIWLCSAGLHARVQLQLSEISAQSKKTVQKEELVKIGF